MTQALIAQWTRLCSIILVTENNSTLCSVGHFPEHLWGDTIKSRSHCLFKVIIGLVVLLGNNLLYEAPKGNYHMWTGVDFEVASQVERAALVTHGHSVLLPPAKMYATSNFVFYFRVGNGTVCYTSNYTIE
jgi:hypothetical protein